MLKKSELQPFNHGLYLETGIPIWFCVRFLKFKRSGLGSLKLFAFRIQAPPGILYNVISFPKHYVNLDTAFHVVVVHETAMY